MGYPFFRKARTHKTFVRNTGNLLLNGTAWADLPTIGTTWDAALRASVGDVLYAEVAGAWNNEAVWAYLDAVTIVAGAPVSSFGAQGAVVAGGSGVLPWRGPTGLFLGIAGGMRWTLAAGDIASGRATVRLRCKTLTAANKTLYAEANNVLQFTVENLGPAAS